MSRELILITKRKYEDLISQAKAHNKDLVTNKVEGTNSPHTTYEDHKNDDGNITFNESKGGTTTETTAETKKYNNEQSKVDENQRGGGDSKPFAKMTFESFDKMHVKLRRRRRSNEKKRRWLTFHV